MKKTFLAVALALAASSAFAADVGTPSFTYIQGAVTSTNLPATNGYGVDVSGSLALGDTFYVNGSWNRANLDVAGADKIKGGLGARFEIVPGGVVYGDAFLSHDNVNFKDWTNLKTFSSYGYGVEGGLRYNVTKNFEVRGGAETSRTTADSAWTTYGTVGASYALSDHWSVTGDAKFHSSTDREYQAGVRFEF